MRFMLVKRLGLFTVCALGLVLMVGGVQAGAAGSPRVLKFYDPPGVSTTVGFNANSNAAPPIGASQVVQVVLENVGSQFGKPSGTKVGRGLLDCTILAVNPPNGDGVCSGIAHVPNGYFTFGGNGIFQNNKVNLWAITGGVGPYANARGQIAVKNNANGSSVATVTLYTS
jgi:hypothetical protein